MKKRELVQAIKECSKVCVPIFFKGYKDWMYVDVGKAELMESIQKDKSRDYIVEWGGPGTTLWIEPKLS